MGDSDLDIEGEEDDGGDSEEEEEDDGDLNMAAAPMRMKRPPRQPDLNDSDNDF